jgi:hypothetical protein
MNPAFSWLTTDSIGADLLNRTGEETEATTVPHPQNTVHRDRRQHWGGNICMYDGGPFLGGFNGMLSAFVIAG